MRAPAKRISRAVRHVGRNGVTLEFSTTKAEEIPIRTRIGKDSLATCVVDYEWMRETTLKVYRGLV